MTKHTHTFLLHSTLSDPRCNIQNPNRAFTVFLLQNLDYERFPRIYGGQLPSIVMESTSQSQKTCFKYKTYYDKQLPKNLRWPMAIFHTGVILFDLSKCVCQFFVSSMHNDEKVIWPGIFLQQVSSSNRQCLWDTSKQYSPMIIIMVLLVTQVTQYRFSSGRKWKDNQSLV